MTLAKTGDKSVVPPGSMTVHYDPSENQITNNKKKCYTLNYQDVVDPTEVAARFYPIEGETSVFWTM